MLPRPVSQPWLNEAVGTMEWTGTPLRPTARRGRHRSAHVDVVFTGADHGVDRGIEQDYARSLPLAEALLDDVLLVYEANGAPLLPQHGYPLRLVVPGWYGMAHVKWLRSIELIDHEFDGFQQSAYRIRESADDPGRPITRIEPRALVIPPGWPDFMSRSRFLRPGQLMLEGRAWSGWGAVTSVEVTRRRRADLGRGRARARGTDRWAWRRWKLPWHADRGPILDQCARGRRDRPWPSRPRSPWNRGGFANPTARRSTCSSPRRCRRADLSTANSRKSVASTLFSAPSHQGGWSV